MQPGRLEHGVHVSHEAPSRQFFVDRWQAMESLQGHFEVPASVDFVKSIAALA